METEAAANQATSSHPPPAQGGVPTATGEPHTGGGGAAAAEEHIQEAMALVGAIGLDAVHTHLAAALTSLQLDDPEGEHERGHASPPPPNTFEIAASVVGVMDEATQQPTPGELLEVLELVQAGTGAKRSHN